MCFGTIYTPMSNLYVSRSKKRGAGTLNLTTTVVGSVADALSTAC
jgi:hypothetical protein